MFKVAHWTTYFYLLTIFMFICVVNLLIYLLFSYLLAYLFTYLLTCGCGVRMDPMSVTSIVK